jgi:hypothetical protein
MVVLVTVEIFMSSVCYINVAGQLISLIFILGVSVSNIGLKTGQCKFFCTTLQPLLSHVSFVCVCKSAYENRVIISIFNFSSMSVSIKRVNKILEGDIISLSLNYFITQIKIPFLKTTMLKDITHKKANF